MTQPDHLPADISDASFWKKVSRRQWRDDAFRKAGRKTLYPALVLYYTLRDDKTPAWCKGVIVGALGYFISLIDAIPDLTPLLGYTDDVSVMIAAMAMLAKHITPESKEKAQQTVDGLLPPKPENSQTDPQSPTNKD